MEEFIQGGDRAVYQGFFQKLQREKRLPEQDKAYLKEKNPELYEMVESLEQELVIYKEKLKNCSSKEEVQELKESYEDGLLLGISLVESNPVFPLEKKLEYTMYKDTKLSMMDKMIEEFVRTPEYDALPKRDESVEGEKTDDTEQTPLTAEEELKLKERKRARAVSSYAGARKNTGAQEPAPFDVKG